MDEEDDQYQNENILHNFENNYLNKRRFCNYCLIISIIIIIAAIICSILIFLYLNNQSQRKEKEDIEDKKEKEYEDNPYKLDTISFEELNKAREDFLQSFYLDKDNPNLIISYNLFFPKNYSKSQKYPMIIFIGDESTFGKEVNLPIFKTVGGPIWGTETIQKKNNCFILVPQYNINLTEQSYIEKQYLNITINLISKIQKDYNIDSNRIYGTGQSIGAKAIVDLISLNKNLFASILIINAINLEESLINLVNISFTYIASEENKNAYNTQKNIMEYFESSNLKFSSALNVDPLEEVGKLNNIAIDIYKKALNYNFIRYTKRSNNNTQNTTDIELNKYGYRIESVRDWLFLQNKITCQNGYYYSYK